MANDDETLTFRLRAIAENMAAFGKAARGADEVNSAMLRSRKTAEALAVSNRKLTAARDKEADAAGRVRTAEAKLNDVRANTKSKMSQIAAAEERLATARRNSSRASNDANRIEADFKNTAEKALGRIAQNAGEDSGRRFTGGFRKTFKSGSRQMDDDVEKKSKIIGASFGSGILSGLATAMRAPAPIPAVVVGAIAAALLVFAPAIGGALAGGVVLAFGAGLTTLGIVFAAKSEVVRAKWRTVVTQMGRDMELISKPFEGVLIHLAGSVQKTFRGFAPILQKAFAVSAGPVQKFADAALGALERFKPAIMPITNAFNALLASLGPALQNALGSIAKGLADLSASVEKNPNALPDLISNTGQLTQKLLDLLAGLNNVNGAFERFTGGTSLVDVAFGNVGSKAGWFIDIVKRATNPVGALTGGIRDLGAATKPVGAGFHATATSAAEAATATGYWTQGLSKAELAAMGITGATTTAAPAVKNLGVTTKEAAQRITDAARATEDWVAQLTRLQNLNLNTAEATLRLKESFTAANAALATNGKNLNLNTKGGQENRKTLLAVAAAAQTQTESMTRNGYSIGAVNAAAAASRASFIQMALRMGYTSAAAQKMANDFLSIPEVVLKANAKNLNATLTQVKKDLKDPNLTAERRAELTATKVDLEKKIAAAKRQLADPKLIAAREAKLTATKANLDKQLKAANKDLANPNLTKERRAKLTATKVDLEKKIKAAKTELASPLLVKARIARLQANKTNLDTQLRNAKRQLADPNLTKERKAKLNADIASLTRRIKQAQAQINGLKGKVVNVTYKSFGVTTWSSAHTEKGVAATGKKITGPGTGTSDTAGVFALSNNEWVIKAKSSQKYGDKAMASVNAGTATILPGMAAGGRPNIAMNKYGVFPNLRAGVAWTDKKFGGGNGLAFARSQVGKPYIWGGVGPRGYDCSGFQSAIVNVIKGRNPYHRLFATGTLPGGLFAPGAGRYNIGWFRGSLVKGRPGHMAGTLNGVNVESRGGQGVVVGSGARGASNSMFTSGVWHLKGYAKGGKAALGGRGGDPPFDGFGDWMKKLKSYAGGTPYVPHDGLAYLHRGERVTPAADNIPQGGDIHFHLEGAIIANQQQALDWLAKGVNKLVSQRRVAVNHQHG